MFVQRFVTLVALVCAASSISDAFSVPRAAVVMSHGFIRKNTAMCILRMSEGESSGTSDAEESTAEVSSSSGSLATVKDQSVSVVKSLFQKIDDGGQKLKPMALTAKEKASTEGRKKSILYSIKSCLLFSLFILYRAYRGFFVILPAVFRDVYAKLDTAVESPFLEDDDNMSKGVNPETGKVRKRTTLTVSVLASLVTVSYVVSGAFRVVGKFFKTVFSSHKAATSFEAAADEVVLNEDKMLRLTEKQQDINDMKINGEGLTGLAP